MRVWTICIAVVLAALLAIPSCFRVSLDAAWWSVDAGGIDGAWSRLLRVVACDPGKYLLHFLLIPAIIIFCAIRLPLKGLWVESKVVPKWLIATVAAATPFVVWWDTIKSVHEAASETRIVAYPSDFADSSKEGALDRARSFLFNARPDGTKSGIERAIDSTLKVAIGLPESEVKLLESARAILADSGRFDSAYRESRAELGHDGLMTLMVATHVFLQRAIAEAGLIESDLRIVGRRVYNNLLSDQKLSFEGDSFLGRGGWIGVLENVIGFTISIGVLLLALLARACQRESSSLEGMRCAIASAIMLGTWVPFRVLSSSRIDYSPSFGPALGVILLIVFVIAAAKPIVSPIKNATVKVIVYLLAFTSLGGIIAFLSNNALQSVNNMGPELTMLVFLAFIAAATILSCDVYREFSKTLEGPDDDFP